MELLTTTSDSLLTESLLKISRNSNIYRQYLISRYIYNLVGLASSANMLYVESRS